jgi:hypothetical protein
MQHNSEATHLIVPLYGKRTIADRQVANFCAEGLNTLT